MQRCNFTLDDNTLSLLNSLAEQFYGGNKSLTIRAALESLAAHTGHDGWVIGGYTPVIIGAPAECHTCHQSHQEGDVLYRPVFERGRGDRALQNLPAQTWFNCARCVEKQ